MDMQNLIAAIADFGNEGREAANEFKETLKGLDDELMNQVAEGLEWLSEIHNDVFEADEDE